MWIKPLCFHILVIAADFFIVEDLESQNSDIMKQILQKWPDNSPNLYCSYKMLEQSWASKPHQLPWNRWWINTNNNKPLIRLVTRKGATITVHTQCKDFNTHYNYSKRNQDTFETLIWWLYRVSEPANRSRTQLYPMSKADGHT